ncbi:MAG TPA: DNA polymerase/3'-5' exonuclease PolX [Thermoleophilaceae bacterium]|nr:DNA polymerase/3'-5' exonuclease PolX [Thermoleophilaceae bacterium]
MRNAEIAAHFDELADLYELDGAIVHRVVAYRNAAAAIRNAPRSVEELARAGRATELAGVGKTIAEKIDTVLERGRLPQAEQLLEKFPAGIVEITRIPGFGPKRARRVFDELGIRSREELRHAAEAQLLREVQGFGARAEENVLATLAADPDGSTRERVLLSRVRAIGEEIVAVLREHPACERAELAGSARRMTETCKDLDVVAAATDRAALVEAFGALSQLEVSSASESGARAVTHNGLPIDLRVVAPETFGNLLQHLTGSGAHNEALRTQAVRRGLHVSEYGVLDDERGTTHACASEDEVYRVLGLAYVPPELRENRGEIEAARAGELPELVRVDSLRGDLHCHTVASDGRATVERMAAAALERGLDYLAITDHSASHGFGNEVSPDALRRHIEHIHAVGEGLGDDFRLLAGSEVNVLPDGSLDYDDELLSRLDWVIASVHSSFRLDERAMTDRMMRAIEHPLVDAIGHPTGRLIERRDPYALDLDRVFEAAARTGTFLEINGNPDRRDLSELNARRALAAGVTLVIDSDAHGPETLANVAYGVATARRAWVEAGDVANTRSWEELDAMRRRSSTAADV